MRRALIISAAVVTLLLAACGSPPVPTQPTQAGGGGGAGAGGIQTAQVAGDWLGPAPGDTGGCGTAYSEWLLEQNGSYAVTDNSESCAGFTNYGTYRLQGSTMSFHQTGSTCGDCGSADYAVIVSLPAAGTMQMCDLPSDGRCYTYHRQ